MITKTANIIARHPYMSMIGAATAAGLGGTYFGHKLGYGHANRDLLQQYNNLVQSPEDAVLVSAVHRPDNGYSVSFDAVPNANRLYQRHGASAPYILQKQVDQLK